MPESRGKNLSAESIDALLVALGLSDPQMGPSVDLETHNNADRKQSKRLSNPARKSSLAVLSRPTAPFSHHIDIDPSDLDEAQIFGRDYLSDFDICTDLEEDSDMEYDTMPPRPDSSVDNFEMVDSESAAHYASAERYSMSSDLTFVPPEILGRVPDTLFLKVAYNASIVMLRVPWDISFMDLKRRLYDKFVNQQGIFLSHTFSVVLALRPSSLSSPLSSPDPERASFAERTQMQFINHESEWRRIASMSDGSKITLRILDTPS